MASLLKSTKNTRWLEDSHRYVRSDVLDKLTKEDIRFLEEHNIRTVVDLRDEAERERQPCVLEKREGFTYYHLPATGGNFAPHSQEEVIRSYIRMADAQMGKILKTIEEAPTNVLYFCSAGKDRTGVVSALLLRRMGIGKDQIVQDYMQSKAGAICQDDRRPPFGHHAGGPVYGGFSGVAGTGKKPIAACGS